MLKITSVDSQESKVFALTYFWFDNMFSATSLKFDRKAGVKFSAFTREIEYRVFFYILL